MPFFIMGRLIKEFQTNFTAGELDPLLRGRTDIKHYYNGADKLRNVFPIPQGGVKRRPGLRLLAEESLANITRTKLAPFSFNTEQEYLLFFKWDSSQAVGSEASFDVYKNDVFLVNVALGIVFTDQDQIRDLSYTQSADVMVVAHEDLIPRFIIRDSANELIWTVGGIVLNNIPQFDFTGGGAVNVWSAASGWPHNPVFYQGRLYFGGSRDRPQTIWGSKVGATNVQTVGPVLITDFDVGTQLDDEAIDFTIETDQVNAITGLVSGRNLQIFTTGGEFFVTQQFGQPITPTSVSISQQGSVGSERFLRQYDIAGATVFVQRNGGAVREFLFSDLEQAYNSSNLSLLSSHLIGVGFPPPIIPPLDFAVRKSLSTTETDYILAVTASGNLLVCATVRDQEITAWTLQEARDQFFSTNFSFAFTNVAALLNGNIYCLLFGGKGASQNRFLVKFDNNHLLDVSRDLVASLPTDTFTAAMPEFPNLTLYVVADGIIETVVTDGAGTFTTSFVVQNSIEVGNPFFVQVKDMPAEPNAEDGTAVGKKKRIVEATLRVQETEGFKVNGDDEFFRQFGSPPLSPLDSAIPEFTGDHTIEGLLGYDEFGQIEITQELPLKMTLLAIQKLVSM